MTQIEQHTENRSTVVSERPWGAFELFTLNEISSVKVITVLGGRRLSLQRHAMRSELWQVLDGPMDVEVDDRAWEARQGELVWVPAGATHRMGNRGDVPARILEVAFGVFHEHDIERLADDFGR